MLNFIAHSAVQLSEIVNMLSKKSHFLSYDALGKYLNFVNLEDSCT